VDAAAELAKAGPKYAMLRRAYDRMMRLSAGPRAFPALAIIAFAESSVFPIPPDVLIVPMVLAAPERAWRIATVATVASVLGGFLGYGIGHFAFATVGEPVLRFYGAIDRYHELQDLYDRWGAWLIIVKGATPIPYKLVTIASGAFHFDLTAFAGASLVSRGIRFFLLASLLWYFGQPIKDFVESRLTLVTSVFTVMVIGGFLLLRFV
jgi:membrane protein YqaA with SNARE-associated domain